MTERSRSSPFSGPVPRLASPSAVTALARHYGIPLQGRLGQNFLIDGNVAGRIADALELDSADTVLEIGPGMGALTQELLERARRVVAVEIDPVLATLLEDVLGDHEGLHIIRGDARRLSFPELLPGPGPWKAVGNLPYYATSPLLFKLLETAPPFDTIVVMVQREVAQRIVASPGGKDYGVLSVNVQYRSQAEILFHVPPTVFIPRPEVHSAVVRLRPHPKPETLPVPPDHMAAVVRAAFSRRRKTIRNALRSAFPPDGVEAALARAHIAGERRAETLSVEEFVQLAAALPPSGHEPSPA